MERRDALSCINSAVSPIARGAWQGYGNPDPTGKGGVFMILCCGEALIDMLPRKTEAGEDAFMPCPGGAVFNTAIALRRLGAPSGLCAGLSADLFGDMLRSALDADGVDRGHCITTDRPTTLAFVTLGNGSAGYAFHDENSAGRMLRPDDMPEPGAGVSAMFFGGISLAAEPCASAFEAMAQAAGRWPIMLDPNIRPGHVRDEAGYRARLGRMIAMADIVKLSDEDLHWLEGPGRPEDLAAALLSRGPGLVAVTQGDRGAFGVTRRGRVAVAAMPARVVDTVGAGDTFNAGMLCALHDALCLTRAGIAALDDAVLRRALAHGASAAAVTVSRAGANPPYARELA